LKVITEPRRREMLRLVWRDGLTVGQIADAFEISLAAVSQHLGVLRSAGFATVVRDGNRRIYRADHDGLGDLVVVLEAMWASKSDVLVQTIRADLAPGQTPGQDQSRTRHRAVVRSRSRSRSRPDFMSGQDAS
jgi:DNA-binding transcriptional ArsR family regulator